MIDVNEATKAYHIPHRKVKEGNSEEEEVRRGMAKKISKKEQIRKRKR